MKYRHPRLQFHNLSGDEDLSDPERFEQVSRGLEMQFDLGRRLAVDEMLAICVHYRRPLPCWAVLELAQRLNAFEANKKRGEEFSREEHICAAIIAAEECGVQVEQRRINLAHAAIERVSGITIEPDVLKATYYKLKRGGAISHAKLNWYLSAVYESFMRKNSDTCS